MPSGSIETVPPWGGFTNVGNEDDTGESGTSISGLETVEELRSFNCKVGVEKGMWNFRDDSGELASAGLNGSRRTVGE